MSFPNESTERGLLLVCFGLLLLFAGFVSGVKWSDERVAAAVGLADACLLQVGETVREVWDVDERLMDALARLHPGAELAPAPDDVPLEVEE